MDTSQMRFVALLLTVVLTLLSVSGEKYFHYTTKNSGDAIKQSGYIQSSNTGAVGKGVYLTKMSPFVYGASQIAYNNWQNYDTAKTKRVFEIEISSGVKDADLNQRDVYIYTKGNLEFKDKSWIYYDWPSGVKGQLKVLASGTQFLKFSSSITTIFVVVSFSFFA
ncbi:uncharacterized protein [Mytilus edulis]|uniref:uncharacterized protein n=1 Tax=Mytilus edulis TaxID=6550 RepID=UPI0039EF34BC